ncbi:unnamed protein product [Danaus chrysippus]|uniref:(African queen) hypothetical protein n=1 Tax=Danaus chrysippus TaxID=151541 RepID=A0A8J2QP81_9NEOP|nr:unnamed protein product [Danaus chrysippus]
MSLDVPDSIARGRRPSSHVLTADLLHDHTTTRPYLTVTTNMLTRLPTDGREAGRVSPILRGARHLHPAQAVEPLPASPCPPPPLPRPCPCSLLPAPLVRTLSRDPPHVIANKPSPQMLLT